MKHQCPPDVLAYLEARCDRDGVHLIWNRATNNYDMPILTVTENGVRKSMPVKRWVYLRGGGRINKGYGVVSACDNVRCVAPGCLVQRSPKEQIEARRHLCNEFTAKRAMQYAQHSKRMRKYTEEQIAQAKQMRADGMKLREIAEALGCSQSTVHYMMARQDKPVAATVFNATFALQRGTRSQHPPSGP